MRHTHANVLGGNARQLAGALLHALDEIARNAAKVEHSDGDRRPSVSQRQRPRVCRLANACYAPFVSWLAMKSGQLNSQRRRDLSYAFARFKHRVVRHPSCDSRFKGLMALLTSRAGV